MSRYTIEVALDDPDDADMHVPIHFVNQLLENARVGDVVVERVSRTPNHFIDVTFWSGYVGNSNVEDRPSARWFCRRMWNLTKQDEGTFDYPDGLDDGRRCKHCGKPIRFMTPDGLLVCHRIWDCFAAQNEYNPASEHLLAADKDFYD